MHSWWRIAGAASRPVSTLTRKQLATAASAGLAYGGLVSNPGLFEVLQGRRWDVQRPSSSGRHQVVRCDPEEPADLTPSRDQSRTRSVVSLEKSVPEVATTWESFRLVYALSCWAIVMSVWLAAGVGPVYVLSCVFNGAWDSLLTFLCFWLFGSVIKFPAISCISSAIATGLEIWFKKFEIDYEHVTFPEAPLKCSSQKTIYCYHPHGLFSLGAVFLAADLIKRGEKVAFVTSSHMRWFNPIAKLVMDLADIEIIGATGPEVQAAMKKGERSLILVPGGYEEAVFTQNGFERLFLNARLGFVKYAMRYGYSLTPVYAYGENDLYTCVPIACCVRDMLAEFKIPIALFYGHPAMPLLPIRSGLRIVVGQPLNVERIAEPAIQKLRDTHALYVDQLMQMYYRYNYDSNRPLEII